MLAPICLFTYNRLNETKTTIDALKQNFLAKESDLIIFSDGPKNEASSKKVKEVRNYIQYVDGFKSVKIIVSEKNKGLANSIIDGVSQILDEYGKVIVLEDDLVTSKNFLDYMNQNLDYYKNHEEIFSISSYTCPIKKINDDVYFTMRASSWGWATWKNRWYEIDWSLKKYESFIYTSDFKIKFNLMGSDMNKMLQDYKQGKINSWAIRWCLHQCVKNTFTVYPTVSKVQNIGTSTEATHTKDKYNRFYTKLDKGSKRFFSLIENPYLDKYYIKQFLNQYTIITRIKYKLLNLIPF